MKASLFGKTELKASSYEQGRQKAVKLFLQYDPIELISRRQFSHDDCFIYISLLGRDYRVNRKTADAEYCCPDGYCPADYYAAMILYDVISCSDPSCFASGLYTPLQNLSAVSNARSYAGERMFDPMIRSIADAPERFRSACLALGGIEDPIGDVSYIIPCLSYHGTLSVLLRFFEADEDFPPQLTLLFDRSTLQYMHYETAWYLAAHVLKRVAELADF